MKQKDKPRVRFCWACGNKLRGNHYFELNRGTTEVHKGAILHVQCAKALSVYRRKNTVKGARTQPASRGSKK